MAKLKQNSTKSADHPAISYLGQHLRGVDHGRVILPVEWRPESSPRDFKVIAWPVDTRDYLLVLPPARWEIIQRNLESLSLADEQAAIVERLISCNTTLGSLDRYGRLALPEDAAKKMGIEKEAMLVGRLNKFEVWSPSRFADGLAKPTGQVIADALKSIKL